ncbi:MAG: helix-hairpin-helix domain-containing protein, partial [Anaerolineales bacterium]
MDTLTGSVSGIVYYNAENGYCVLRLKVEGHKPPLAGDRDEVIVVGNLPQLSPGESVRFQGNWTRHVKHGWQFQSEFCEQISPATVEGIRRYLGSGLIKGIGPALAQRIVDTFGVQTLEILDNQPLRLLEAPDIGKQRLQKILRAWDEQKQIKELMLFLHSYGVSTNLAVKIYKQYGDQSLSVVQNDPYRLAQDIYGVGFKTADKLAQSLGLPPDHPGRIEAGILYTLNSMSDEGHVYAPQQLLIQKTAELLNVSEDLIPSALQRLQQNGKCLVDNQINIVSSNSKTPHQVDERQSAYGSAAWYLA